MNSVANTRAIEVRCPACGLNNPISDPSCKTCGTMLPLFPEACDPASHWPASKDKGRGSPQMEGLWPWPSDVPADNTASKDAQINKPSALERTSRGSSKSKFDLTGRVIIMESAHQERADFDWFKCLTKLMWFLLIVASPVLLLHGILLKLGVLPALLAVAGMFYLLRFISPSNLLSMVFLSAMLNPLRRQEREMVPVRYFRIRDDEEVEWVARLKGDLCLGNISTDDLVSLKGTWRGGTLFVTSGYNHGTRSRIAVRTGYSWIGFVLTLCIVFFLVSYFWGPTHALMERMHELGSRP
ncbi:MAG: hypothetical protein IH623_10330 [Verrucomicrobia bacterium]|nr:hypothetical protein [Verrucomicrobiota bacterium]